MEIGSIFEIDINSFFRKEYKKFTLPFMEGKNYNHYALFNTGRSAIEFVVRNIKNAKGIKKILVPSFICSSVIDAIHRAGLEFDYYSISEDFEIDINDLQDKLTTNNMAIFVVQYFGGNIGSASYDFLMGLQSNGYLIIEDITLSLYTFHAKHIGFGNYVVGSIRKWLPIPDGAFLSATEEFDLGNVLDGSNEYALNYLVAQLMKSEYLKDKKVDKREFLNFNKIAMKALFSDYKIRCITHLSKKILHTYDMDTVIKNRRRNYNYLIDNTAKLTYFHPAIMLNRGQVPLGFVIVTEYRNELFRYLVDNNIYCNIHWDITDKTQLLHKTTSKLSNSIITIPCDQRYGRVEMDYIVDHLSLFQDDLN